MVDSLTIMIKHMSHSLAVDHTWNIHGTGEAQEGAALLS